MPGMDCGSEGETEVGCEKWIEKVGDGRDVLRKG